MQFTDPLPKKPQRFGQNLNWFGVWGVQDYYTILEDRAKAGAKITFGYFLMVIASAVLATGGLLINSPSVVIGSMCVAPFLGSRPPSANAGH